MLLIYHADIGGGAVWTMYSPTSKHTDIYSYTQISIATNRYLHPHWELHILRNVYRMSKPKNMLDQVHAATHTHTHTHTHTQSMFCFHFPILSIAIHIWWRRKWQPIPVFLPGKCHGQRRLAGLPLWSHKESDTTEHIHTFTREPTNAPFKPLTSRSHPLSLWASPAEAGI